MQVDPDGLLIVCVACAVLGFLIGWMGGVIEGREQERKRASGVTPCEPCPRGNDKPEPTCTNRHQCWEPCGELGKSEEHVRVGRQSTDGVRVGCSHCYDGGCGDPLGCGETDRRNAGVEGRTK
jgi:hypothetical protein